MAEYQRIEYRIGKDGKVTETVINASGSSCTTTTSEMEMALGKVEQRQLLPEYYAEDELTIVETQSTNQT